MILLRSRPPPRGPVRISGETRAATPTSPSDDPHLLREVERRHVLAMLRQEKGNKVRAAKVMGISRRALYRLIAKYRFSDGDYRGVK